MPYQLTWKTPGAVLVLNLSGFVSVDEFVQINTDVTKTLEELNSDQKIAVVIEIDDAKQLPNEFAYLRTLQTFVTSYRLKHIVVVGRSKYMRLMMQLIYGQFNIRVHMVDSYEQALIYFPQQNLRGSNPQSKMGQAY